VLVSGSLGLLAGCRRANSGAAPAPSAEAVEPDPLVPDLADEQRLLTVYDRALHDHPELTGRLRPLRSNHAAHVAALRQAMGLPAGAGTANPTGSPPPPASAAATLAALRSLEHAAVLARTASAVRTSGGRAALLASLAACAASHEELLV
jgi:hypothetical protein